jgi:hypothetical protein
MRFLRTPPNHSRKTSLTSSIVNSRWAMHPSRPQEGSDRGIARGHARGQDL